MKKYKLLYLFLILLCTIHACTLRNNNEKVSTIRNEIEGILKKDILIPRTLELYAPFSLNYNIDSLHKKAKLKIFTSINVSCSACLHKIPIWADFKERNKDLNVEIFLICKSDDNFEIFKYWCESKQFTPVNIPFYCDINNEYLQGNSFMNLNDQYNTVLTDLQNNILMVGDPTSNEQTEKSYINFIREYIRADK